MRDFSFECLQIMKALTVSGIGLAHFSMIDKDIYNLFLSAFLSFYIPIQVDLFLPIIKPNINYNHLLND